METRYVRAKGGSAWHWRRDCSRFPRTLHIQTSRRDRPMEDLCDECRTREYLESFTADRLGAKVPKR